MKKTVIAAGIITAAGVMSFAAANEILAAEPEISSDTNTSSSEFEENYIIEESSEEVDLPEDSTENVHPSSEEIAVEESGEAGEDTQIVVEFEEVQDAALVAEEQTLVEAASGVLQNGWNASNDMYFVNGEAVKGQLHLDGYWYCFDIESGKMFADGEFYLDARYQAGNPKYCYYDTLGRMIHGQMMLVGSNYHYYDSVTGGRVENSFQTVGGSKYYFGNGGNRVSGEQAINGSWYLFDVNGVMQTGFQTLKKADYSYLKADKTVYYNSAGKMLYGQQYLGGNWYCFDLDSGNMFANGEFYLNQSYQPGNPKYCYYDSNGRMVHGQMVQIGSNYRYYDAVTGQKAVNSFQRINGNKYYFDGNGNRVSGEKSINGYWYLFDANGIQKTGFQTLKKADYSYLNTDKTVYYDSLGRMQYKQQYINGHWYCFDKDSGSMITGEFRLTTDYQPQGAKTVRYSEKTDSLGQMVYGNFQTSDGKWFSYDSVTGAKKSYTLITETVNGTTGKRYYGSSGTIETGQKAINGKWYFFDPENNGFAAVGLIELKAEYNHGNAKTVYYNADGTMFYGQKYIDEHWRFFDLLTGEMVKNNFVVIPASYNSGVSKTCYYDGTGCMVYGTHVIGKNTYTFDVITGDVTKAVISGITYLNQGDAKWGNIIVGHFAFASTGCVPTALTMAINYLTGSNLTPIEVGTTLYQNGLFNDSLAGADGYTVVEAGKLYGLTVTAASSVVDIANCLKSGGVATAAMNPGIFCSPGYTHEILLYGYDGSTGTAMTNVYDPLWSSHNGQYDIQTIWNQKSTHPSDCLLGGPIFLITKA